MNRGRIICWFTRKHKWARKRAERFCYRCGRREILIVLPGGKTAWREIPTE